MRVRLPTYTTTLKPAAAARPYELVYDSTTSSVDISNGSAWTTLTTAATGTADQVYNAGSWAVAVDANDVAFTLATGYNMILNAAASGTTAVALEINDNTTGKFTDGILFTATNAIVDAIDASAANITNAINVGANNIVGTTAVINFDAFDVNATGDVACHNVSCNDLTVAGTWSIATTLGIGVDGTGQNMVLYSNTSGDNITWDAATKCFYTTDAHLHLTDNDELHFGTSAGVKAAGDFKIYCDGTNLQIQAVANVASQAVYIGNDTNELDIIWEGTTNGSTVQFDSDINQVIWTTASMKLKDSTHCYLGTGAGTEGDFDVYSDGTDLYIAAIADVVDQAVKIGSATNDIDLIVYGDTTGNTFMYDASADQVKITSAGAALTGFAMTSTSTSVSSATISNNAALADNCAVLALSGTGNIAAGGNVLRLSYATGTVDADARILEFVGTGKDLRGIFADVDGATNDVYTFHSGGAVGSGKAVMKISGDAAANAASFLLLIDGSSATWATSNPKPFKTTTVGTGPVEIESTNTGTLGAQLDLRHTPGNSQQADNDVVGRIRFYGQDDAAGAAENLYGYIDMVATDSAAASEDSRLDIYVQKGGAAAAAYLSVAPDLVTIGNGAAGILTSNGAQDLTLETNSGTNSGTITITNGANNNITLTPNGTGDVVCAADTLVVGDAGAAATITSNGAGNLTINTNAGTNSGSIVIAQGANGDITVHPNGTGTIILTDASVQYHQREVAAGTATDAPDNNDGLVEYSTDGAQACAVTLPEAASNLGLVLTFAMATDGGKDVTITRAGADVIDDTGDLANTTITLGEAGDMIQIMAVLDNNWLVVKNVGAALA